MYEFVASQSQTRANGLTAGSVAEQPAGGVLSAGVTGGAPAPSVAFPAHPFQAGSSDGAVLAHWAQPGQAAAASSAGPTVPRAPLAEPEPVPLAGLASDGSSAFPAAASAATGSYNTNELHSVATAGIGGAHEQLPFFDQIQHAFGLHHDLSDVRASVGGAALQATETLGARAYAQGNRIAFGAQPDLHLVAHEAAHVIQQRHGQAPQSGLSTAGDVYEQAADAVADRVVAGESATDLLPSGVASAPQVAIQRKEKPAEQLAGMWSVEVTLGPQNAPFRVTLQPVPFVPVARLGLSAKTDGGLAGSMGFLLLLPTPMSSLRILSATNQRVDLDIAGNSKPGVTLAAANIAGSKGANADLTITVSTPKSSPQTAVFASSPTGAVGGLADLRPANRCDVSLPSAKEIAAYRRAIQMGLLQPATGEAWLALVAALGGLLAKGTHHSPTDAELQAAAGHARQFYTLLTREVGNKGLDLNSGFMLGQTSRYTGAATMYTRGMRLDFTGAAHHLADALSARRFDQAMQHFLDARERFDHWLTDSYRQSVHGQAEQAALAFEATSSHEQADNPEALSLDVEIASLRLLPAAQQLGAISEQLHHAYLAICVQLAQLRTRVHAGAVNDSDRTPLLVAIGNLLGSLAGAAPKRSGFWTSPAADMAERAPYELLKKAIASLLQQSAAAAWPAVFQAQRAVDARFADWLAQQLTHRADALEKQQGECGPQARDAKGLAEQVRYLSGLQSQLHDLEGRGAQRIQAVFFPQIKDDPSASLAQDRHAIDHAPLTVFAYQNPSNHKWVIKDLTNPKEPAGKEYPTLSGDSLHDLLEEGSRLPAGSVYYRLPLGESGVVTTTGKRKWYEWLGLIGLGLGVIGLGLLTLGASVPATAVLLSGSVVGAVSAAGDLSDRGAYGTLTTTGAILDVLQIATGFLEVGTVAFGVLNATGKLASFSGKAYVVLGRASAIAGGSQILVFSLDQVQQINAILQGPGSHDDKRRSIMVLLTQWAAMSSLSLWAVKASNKSKSGRIGETVHVDEQGGVITLHVGESTQGSLTPSTRLTALEDRLSQLKGIDLKAHSIETHGPLVRINDQIELAASKLATMTDEQLVELMQLTSQLKQVGGDPNKLTPQQRTLAEEQIDQFSKGGLRLRFRHQLAQAEQHFRKLVGNDARANKILSRLSDADRTRLYDLVKTSLPKAAPHLEQQAASYALSRNPVTGPQFVDYFEFYVATIKNRFRESRQQFDTRLEALRAKRTQGITSNAERERLRQVAHREAAEELFGKPLESRAQVDEHIYQRLQTELADGNNLNVIGKQGAQQLDALYAQRAAQLKGKIGLRQVDPELPDSQLVAAVQKLPNVEFGAESSAVYHVEKHVNELPKAERLHPTNPVADYLHSAQLTIKQGQGEIRINQDGSRTIMFLRTVADGRSTVLRAIVHVSASGKVSLASYGKTN